MFARLGALLLLTLSAAGFLYSQTSTATLQGVVQDSSSGAVAGAKVTVTNVNTGLARDVVSAEDGAFVVPFLHPGTYELVVQKEGFRRYSQANLKLAVQQNLSIPITLELGDVATSVDVTAAPPPLQTSDSTVQTAIQNQSIVDLPLNGRSVLSLAATVPGVYTGVSSASGQSDIYTPQIGGGRIMTSETFVDGAPLSVADPTGGARAMGGLPPSPDAVEEFAVQSNVLAAEYGRVGGGVLNVVTKQGTNGLHGTLRDFFRNSALDANDFFANRNGVPLKSFNRHQFGFSLGGPVYIPKLYNGRNRTFFFIDDEFTRMGQPAFSTTTMPDEKWKVGDFSNLRNFNGDPITIYDPLTTRSDGNGGWIRDPFPGNIIPADRIDPVAAKILSYWPSANRPSQNAYTPFNNFYGSNKRTQNDSNLTVRLDHAISDRWRTYGRFNRGFMDIKPTQFWGGNPAEYAALNTRGRINGVWDNTFIVNPTTTANVRYGFTRWNYQVSPTTKGFNPTQLGFPEAIANQAAAEWMHFPSVSVAGVSGLGGGGGLSWISNSHSVSASVTKALSRHVLKAGVEYRKYYMNFYQVWFGGPNGSYRFDDGWTRANPFQYDIAQGFGFASFLLGYPSGGTLGNAPQQALASSYWAGYIQDDFRVTPKLTLNLGLRYDVDIPRTERYNRMSYYDLGAPSPIAGQVPGFPDLKGAMKFVDEDHRRQTPTDRNNFAPRFGFAYQLTPKTVIRGGYAIIFDASTMQVASHNGGFQGFRLRNDMIVSRDGRIPTRQLSNPFPDGFRQPGRSPSTDLGSIIDDSWFIDYVSPVIQQWNFNVQQTLPGNMVVEAGYIANKGNHIQNGDYTPYNQLDPKYMSRGNQLYEQVPNPFYGVITDPLSILSFPTVSRAQLLRPYPQITGLNLLWRPTGNSNYHALALRVEKRFSSGLGFLTALTVGKLISDSEASGFFSSSGGSSTQNTFARKQERAVSTEDVARRLVVSADYQLPIGKGKRFASGVNGFIDALIGGWQLNGIWTLQTGQPIPIRQGPNQTGLGNGMQRPTNNGQAAEYTEGGTSDKLAHWFDSSVFSITQPFQFGNAPRTITSVRNPGVANLDASLFKTFSILRDDRLKAQLRWEAFNVLNTPQFGRADSTIGWAGTGSINYVAVPPRQMQIALKLIF